ncbi:MAG: methylenetetrahydrofolate reductase [NAD(P)H] [Magnetococcales bacterium]|nr:methylenetetrahydrofolate reductase [NAD(P)H] [Magnetococcales bacterium]
MEKIIQGKAPTGGVAGAGISFEFFPPKLKEKEPAFWKAVNGLARYGPEFVSITYGAGGGSRQRTLELMGDVVRGIDVETVAHLTCVGDDAKALTAVLDTIDSHGITHLLALRGDQPQDMPQGALERGAFRYADGFVAFIREKYPHFRVGVAAYPEVHPEAADAQTDLSHFRRKVEAGAAFAVTQFFFENSAYFSFVEACRKEGINIPIIPGIMPVTDYKQIRRLAQLCGSALPGWLTSTMERLQGDPAQMKAAGIQLAVRQCRELLDGGAPGLHFFTLNQQGPVSQILDALGFQADAAPSATSSGGDAPAGA